MQRSAGNIPCVRTCIDYIRTLKRAAMLVPRTGLILTGLRVS